MSITRRLVEKTVFSGRLYLKKNVDLLRMDVIGNIRLDGFIGRRRLGRGIYLEEFMIDGLSLVQNGVFWVIRLVVKIEN